LLFVRLVFVVVLRSVFVVVGWLLVGWLVGCEVVKVVGWLVGQLVGWL